jgi:hypothetical protein
MTPYRAASKLYVNRNEMKPDLLSSLFQNSDEDNHDAFTSMVRERNWRKDMHLRSYVTRET